MPKLAHALALALQLCTCITTHVSQPTVFTPALVNLATLTERFAGLEEEPELLSAIDAVALRALDAYDVAYSILAPLGATHKRWSRTVLHAVEACICRAADGACKGPGVLGAGPHNEARTALRRLARLAVKLCHFWGWDLTSNSRLVACLERDVLLRMVEQGRCVRVLRVWRACVRAWRQGTLGFECARKRKLVLGGRRQTSTLRSPCSCSNSSRTSEPPRKTSCRRRLCRVRTARAQPTIPAWCLGPCRSLRASPWSSSTRPPR
jgi:hypothetical protein